MVTDTGFYHEIRADCAIKISYDVEHEEIQSALSRMLADPEAVLALASRGQAWARATFTPVNYADQTEFLVQEVLRTEPILNTVNAMHTQLASWFGEKNVALLPAALAKSLEVLSAPPPPRG